MEGMTLCDLGTQYLRQSKAINAQIRKLTAQRKQAPLAELAGLEQRLRTLYEEHNDLKKTGYFLMSYYAKKTVTHFV